MVVIYRKHPILEPTFGRQMGVPSSVLLLRIAATKLPFDPPCPRLTQPHAPDVPVIFANPNLMKCSVAISYCHAPTFCKYV
jgi:hypothetical protein